MNTDPNTLNSPLDNNEQTTGDSTQAEALAKALAASEEEVVPTVLAASFPETEGDILPDEALSADFRQSTALTKFTATLAEQLSLHTDQIMAQLPAEERLALNQFAGRSNPGPNLGRNNSASKVEDAWADYHDEHDLERWVPLNHAEQEYVQPDALTAEFGSLKTAGGLDNAALGLNDTLAGGASELDIFAAPSKVPFAHLVPIHGSIAEEELSLIEPEITLGRAVHNQIVLTEPSVSRVHAKLVLVDKRIWLFDEHSANGTFVNGRKIRKKALVSGDEISLGNLVFNFTIDDPELLAVALASRKSSSLELFWLSVQRLGGSLLKLLKNVGIIFWYLLTFSYLRKPRDPSFGKVGYKQRQSQQHKSSRNFVSCYLEQINHFIWEKYRARRRFCLVMALIVLPTFFLGAGILVVLRVDKVLNSRSVLLRYQVAGKEAFAANQLDVAEKHFLTILQLDSQNELAKRYLQDIQREKVAVSELALAEEYLAKRDLWQAYKLAMAVSNSRFLAREAATILNNIEIALEADLEKAQAAVNNGKLNEAKAILAMIATIHPEWPEVGLLTNRVQSLLGNKVEAPVVENVDKVPGALALAPIPAESPESSVELPAESVNSPTVNPHPAPAEGSVKVVEVVEGEPPDAKPVDEAKPVDLSQARLLFSENKVDEALAWLANLEAQDKSKAVVARSLAKEIKHFKELYAEAFSVYRQKDASKALELLLPLKNLEAKISGDKAGNKALNADIKRKLADMYYLRANEAESPAAAYQDYLTSLKYYPSYHLSEQGLKRLEAEAAELYEKGAVDFQGGDKDGAKKKWQMVLKIVPKTNNWYIKAKKGISELL